MSGNTEHQDQAATDSNAHQKGNRGNDAGPDSLIEELVERVLDVLGQVLPASTLNRFSEQISPAIDAVMAPFQILRRDEFEGYVAQLERLEIEVEGLREQLAALNDQH